MKEKETKKGEAALPIWRRPQVLRTYSREELTKLMSSEHHDLRVHGWSPVALAGVRG